jgi:hypothetical protein
MQDKCIETVGIKMIQGWSVETQESLPISDVMYILLLVWNIVYIVFSVSFPSIYRTYWMEIYGMFYNESNRHNGGATTYPSHCHITWFKKFMTFSILRGIYIVIQAHSFVTFLGINYDKKNERHKLVMIE